MSKDMKLDKVLTVADILGHNPHPDWIITLKYFDENWSGTILDILNMEDCSISCRFQILDKTNIITEKHWIEFSIWCARRALVLSPLCKAINIDQRSINGIYMAEKYLNNQFSDEELKKAWMQSREANEIAYDMSMNSPSCAYINAAYYIAFTALKAIDTVAASRRYPDCAGSHCTCALFAAYGVKDALNYTIKAIYPNSKDANTNNFIVEEAENRVQINKIIEMIKEAISNEQ